METSGEQIKEETVVVVLGASGDLAKKKTFPALFALYSQGYLPSDVHIVGYARTSKSGPCNGYRHPAWPYED